MSLRPVLAARVGANLRPLPPAKVPQAIWALALGTLSYAALLTLAIETLADSATIVDGLKIGALVGCQLGKVASISIDKRSVSH